MNDELFDILMRDFTEMADVIEGFSNKWEATLSGMSEDDFTLEQKQQLGVIYERLERVTDEL